MCANNHPHLSGGGNSLAYGKQYDDPSQNQAPQQMRFDTTADVDCWAHVQRLTVPEVLRRGAQGTFRSVACPVFVHGTVLPW